MSKQENAKKAARALEKALGRMGVVLKHGQALNAIAAIEGYSHWGAMAKSDSLGAKEPAASPAVPHPWLLRMPSEDDGNYDRFVLIPSDMDASDAIDFANKVIAEANREDHENDGECDDGEPVETNIRRRLGARGFVFPNVDTTHHWDAFDPDAPGFESAPGPSGPASVQGRMAEQGVIGLLSNASTKGAGAAQERYVHGGWAHIFHDNGPDTELRFVFDLQARRVVAMEIKRATGWVGASRAEMEDVQDSLVNANEDALEHPEEWGLVRTAALPAWCASTVALHESA